MTAIRRSKGAKVILGVVTTAAMVMSLAACASDGKSTSGGSSKGPIKIGVLPPTSGNAAAYGKEMMNGWDLYWEQHNNEVAGRKVQTIHVDGGASVSTVLSGVNKLVKQDNVSMVVSVMLANVSLALAGPLAKDKIPYVESVAGAMSMTGRNVSPYFVRLGGPSSSQTTHPLGAWAAEQGYKKVITLCSDFNFGYEGCGGFVNTFTDGGGTVVKQLWSPIGTSDFSSYITQIKDAKPDAVFVEFTGADNARFVQAWSSFGMKGKIPLIAGEATLDETVLNGLTPEQAEGLISSGVWANGLDSPAADEFRNAYEAKYHAAPSFYALSMYIAAEGIAKVTTELNGDLSDTQALMDKLRAIQLDSPIGKITVDKYGSQVQDVMIRKVEVKDGKLVNSVIKTYPNVSQFWNYDVEQFLDHPAYSKTYQGNGVWPEPTK